MFDDDDSYHLDARGQRVLIGLTHEETDEFLRLEEAIGKNTPRPQSVEEWVLPEDRRWLELYEKHESARRLSCAAAKPGTSLTTSTTKQIYARRNHFGQRAQNC